MGIRVGRLQGLTSALAIMIFASVGMTVASAQDTTTPDLSVPTVPSQSLDLPAANTPDGAAPGQSADATDDGEAVACFLPPIKLPAEDVEAFLANPAALLTDYAEGGLLLSSRVRALAGSDERTLDPLLALIDTASTEQRAAIGSGLARAATACAPSSEKYAALIQEKVAALDNNELLTAFLSASNDLETAAIAGALGGFVGGAPGLGGVGDPGPSTGPFGDEATPNADGTLTLGFGRRQAVFFSSGSSETDVPENSRTTP